MREQMEIPWETAGSPESREKGLSYEKAEALVGEEVTPHRKLMAFRKDGPVFRNEVGTDEVGTVIAPIKLPDGEGWSVIVRFEERRERQAPATGDQVVGYLDCKVDDPLRDLILSSPARNARAAVPARRGRGNTGAR